MGRKSIAVLRQQQQRSDLKTISTVNDEELISRDSSETQSLQNGEKNITELVEKEDNEREDLKRKRVRKRKKAEDEKEEEPSTAIVTNDRFSNDRTIYMEGLPFEATDETVTAFFAQVGPLVGLRLPRWHDSGRLRGYGHVEFGSSEEASRAMKELNGSYMGKRYIKLDRPMTPRIVQQQLLSATSVSAESKGGAKRVKLTRPAGCRTVFVKNLPYDCTEEDVSESFMVCGKIAKVRLAVWNHTGKLKGFGYVDYKSEESAEIAVNKSVYGGGINVKGRPVICDFEMGQAKGSYKPLTAGAK